MPNETENQSVEDHNLMAAAPATESQDAYDERQESADEHRKRNDVEYNWAEARRARQELERKVKEQEEYIRKHSAPKQAEPEEDFGISDDDLVEGRVVKDIKREIKELKKQLQQKEQSSVQERIRARFSDFDNIVTAENIELLNQKEPELALSLAHTPDPYAQAVAVYKQLKMLGVEESKKPHPDKERASQNSHKPRSVNTIANNSAIGNVHLFENGLTSDLKAQLWKEMEECRKRS